MKFFKNRMRIVVVLLLLLLLGAGILLVKNFYYSSDMKAAYGSRIRDIDKYPVTDKQKKDIEEGLKESTKSAKVRLAGRIIYIDMVVNDEIGQDAAKELGNKAIETLTEEQKAYYDIQVIIGNDGNQDQFPILGYKHHTKEKIRWTRNR